MKRGFKSTKVMKGAVTDILLVSTAFAAFEIIVGGTLTNTDAYLCTMSIYAIMR